MKKRCISLIRKLIIAVFCTFTAFSHCLFGYASNDDEYITFNDAEIIQAYKYFNLYGLTADKSYTYTDTYTTTGSVSLSATMSLSGSGSNNFTGASNNDVLGMIHNFHTDDTEYNIVVNGNTNVGSVNYYGSTNSLNLACTYSNPQTIGGAADAEYATLSCKDPNFNDAIPYYVTLYNQDGLVKVVGYQADDYAIFRRSTDGDYNYETNSDLHLEGLYSFSGSLSVNESGSLSGSGSISLNTTTTNVNKLNYVLPEMSGTINNPNSSNPNFIYKLTKENPFVIAFLGNQDRQFLFDLALNNDINNLLSSSDYFNSLPSNPNSSYRGGYKLFHVESKINLSNDNYNKYYINLFRQSTFNSMKIIPLYVGYKNYMSDSMYRYLYGSDRLLEALNHQTDIIESGNTNSQQKEQALNTQTTQMQNKMTQFQNIEDTAGDNMNTALNNINTNPSLLSNNKFLMSADWIRQQFNRIVTNTPFEVIITFCLVFGLGLLLLGKVR